MTATIKKFFMSIPASLISRGPQAIYLNRSPADAAIFWTTDKIANDGLIQIVSWMRFERSDKQQNPKDRFTSCPAWIARVASISSIACFTFCAQRIYFSSSSVIARGVTYGLYSALIMHSIDVFSKTTEISLKSDSYLDCIRAKLKNLYEKKWEYSGILVADPVRILFGVTSVALTALTKNPILGFLGAGCIIAIGNILSYPTKK